MSGGVSQPALPGAIETAWEDERVECWAFGRKYHLTKWVRSNGVQVSFCGMASAFSAYKPVRLNLNSRLICKSCRHFAIGHLRKLRMPIDATATVRRTFPGCWFVDDQTKWLSAADYLAESPNEHDQRIAEAIRCYWEIKPDEVSVPRKLSLLKRMREVLK